jgi:Skp family chaperone for outer membrane proteins
MRAQGWAAWGVLAALLFTGCGQSADPRQAASGAAVAIIDLDEIARRLGSDKQIAAAISQRQTALSQQLVDLAKSYSAQIDQQKAKLTAENAQPNDVMLASWQNQANANLNKIKLQAEADLQNHRVTLVNSFRDQIKPAARRVAQARGLSIIVTKNDSVVFDYTATADITDAVVDELLASAPPAQAESPAAAPAQSSAPPASSTP